jgi:hypothetical protein
MFNSMLGLDLPAECTLSTVSIPVIRTTPKVGTGFRMGAATGIELCVGGLAVRGGLVYLRVLPKDTSQPWVPTALCA